MVSLNVTGVILLVVASSSAYVLLENDDPTENIIWPSEFYFSAETIDLKDAYIEPFEVWYSAAYNKSRVDYYNGTFKEYYVAETEDDTGYLYNVHPITTEEVRNKFVCFSSSHSGEQPDFLPSVENYKFVEKVDLNGRQVSVWRKKKLLEEDQLSAEATLYVHRTEYDFDIPIKKETKIDNLAKGEVETYIIVNYKRFGYIVDIDDVTYNGVDDCDNMPFLSIDYKRQQSYLSPHRPDHVEKVFDSFKKHHNKNYQHSEEHEFRKEIFHKNWRRVMAHNSKSSSYKMELNQFADRTEEELSFLTGTRPTDPLVQGTMPFPHSEEELLALSEDLPESYDLRLEGYLGPIKNQGACGSCWAFTTTATVEGMTSKFYGGRNLDLSEQSLVDCAWGFENFGCSGGQLDKAFEYILKYGIPKESDYGQYLRKDGFCGLKNDTETFKIRGFARVTPQNPAALKLALVKYGPVAVAIHASSNMKLYSHGVFYDASCEGRGANHGVVVVGYGERDGTPYWIVRNSWGEGFGMDGYILMSQINNNCLVMDTPFYPIV